MERQSLSIADIRKAAADRLLAVVSEQRQSGIIVKGCKNAKAPTTIIRESDAMPVNAQKPATDLNLLLRRPLQCVHLGKRVRECHLYPQLGHTYYCKKLRKNCGRSRFARNIDVCCEDCGTYVADQKWPIEFDEKNLWTLIPGKRFNTSIIEHGDGYLLAFRNGWAGSDIYVGKLNEWLMPIGRPVRLDLKHRRAKYGREDPRLFRFNGQIHVSYIGVVITDNGMRTHQLYCRLNDKLAVDQEFAPRLEQRQEWEKNWAFFEYDGRLHAAYSVKPHRIIEFDGEATQVVAETDAYLPWSGGLLRGGASPVRVADEYYCFFHGKSDRPINYHTGVYTFEAKPPFRITRIAPEPLISGDITTKPDDQWIPVEFACGAVRTDSHWIVTSGVHDRTTAIRRWTIEDIESRLQQVKNPARPFEFAG